MVLLTTPFGFLTTAAEVLAGIDLSGKTMIVTGGASGIGVETVRVLAQAGASVTIAARRVQAAESVAEELRAKTRHGRIDVLELDVADLNSVRSFARRWDKPLDVLVNNAGIMAVPQLERTSEGHELQFGTNFLGHFALAMGLFPWLEESDDGRIVSVASTGSLFGPMLWDDPDFRFISYDPLLAYAQSKTACILLSVAIARKWASAGITSNALNPGAIATNLQRHTGGLRTPAPQRKTLEQGAATSVLLAGSPLLKNVSGRYFDNCNEANVVNERPRGLLAGVADYALDPMNADRLWDMAMHMIADTEGSVTSAQENA